MEAKAVLRYIKIGPRKMRLVIDTIRHKPVATALSILANTKKKGARIAEKVLKSAQANAKVKKMDENRLYVSKVTADGGPSLKRYMPRSMGRADVILKRTTHLTMVLGEKELSRVPTQPDGKKEPQKKHKEVKKEKKAGKLVGAKG